MDTRLLYTISLGIATVVGGFYYFSGKSEKLSGGSGQSLISTATQIQVTQTNHLGQLHAKATIDHVKQWMREEKAEAEKIQGTLFEDNKPTYTFNADQGLASPRYEHIKLLGNITVSQLAPHNQQPELTFKTDELNGDTKQHQVETDSPVNVSSAYANFTSQGMKADLTTGQYEFFKIRGTYAPAR